MPKYDVSIIMPGIRPWEWKNVYESIQKNIGDYTFELIAIGPEYYGDVEQENFRFIHDLGHPCRCAQIGASESNGKLYTWTSDDAVFLPGLQELVRDAQNLSYKDAIVSKYTEDRTLNGSVMSDSWYIAYSHDVIRLPGVGESYKIFVSAIMHLEWFLELGGFDCRYQQVNISTHDLAMRLQNAGGAVHIPRYVTYHCRASHREIDRTPIDQSHNEDLLIFQRDYGHQTDRIRIPFENWKQSPEKWSKRFG